MKADIERDLEREEDIEYIQSQVLGDQEPDIDMDGIERIEDFEYDDYENNDEEEKEGERKPPGKATHYLGLVDQNPEEDSDDENTE